MSQLPPLIRSRLAAQGGVAAVHQFTDGGLDRHVLHRLIQTGALIRLRRDVIVDPQVWNSTPPSGRHRLRALAVMHSLLREGLAPVALSHHSALALFDVELFGVDDRVHLVRTDEERGRSDGLVQVHAPRPPSDVTWVEGIAVLRPARACLQVAAAFGTEAGLVAAESAIRGRLTSPEALAIARARGGYGGGSANATFVADLAAGASESVGETRCRHLFTALGLTTAEQQVSFHDGQGAFIGRTDFYFRSQHTVVEFDGLFKYTDPATLRAEKVREDRLRALGLEVVRLTWADLADPARVRALILAAFARAAARRQPVG